MIIKLLRSVCGYVSFVGEGGFPERFLNLCARGRVRVWGTCAYEEKITGFTTADGYKRLRHIAKKSGVKLRLGERYGLPFFIRRNRNRGGLLLGAVLGVALLCVLSQRIWFIQVKGNETISDTQIVQQFEQFGVCVGVKGESINSTVIQNEAYSTLADYSWLAVNVKGSTATIEVREKNDAPDVVDKNAPCNIVAARDGIIIRLEVYDGIKEISDGYPVVEGDLLVNGITQNEDKSSVLRHAQGKCLASTLHNIEVFVPYKNEYFVFDRNGYTSYTLSLFGKNIPLGRLKEPSGDYKHFETEKFIKTAGVTLPFGIIKQENKGYYKTEVTLDKEQALVLAGQSFAEKAESELGNATVVDRAVDTEYTLDGVKITGAFVCREDIAKEEAINLDEQN